VKSREGFVACLGAVAVSRYDSKSGNDEGTQTRQSPSEKQTQLITGGRQSRGRELWHHRLD